MAEASSITGRQVANVGDMTLYEIKCTATSTNTITIPSNIPVTANSKVHVVSCNNITDGTGLGATVTCTYDDGNTRFTYTESGASAEDVRILFYVEAV